MFPLVIAALMAGSIAGPVAVDDPDDAAIRRIVEQYLASVAHPDATPLDSQLFAEDIEGFWSNGQTYRGRDAFIAACRAGSDEVAGMFETFAGKTTDVTLRRAGEMAWMACRIELKGTLTEDRGEFVRVVRSTFVFQKNKGRWQMVHEHSSRLP